MEETLKQKYNVDEKMLEKLKQQYLTEAKSVVIKTCRYLIDRKIATRQSLAPYISDKYIGFFLFACRMIACQAETHEGRIEYCYAEQQELKKKYNMMGKKLNRELSKDEVVDLYEIAKVIIDAFASRQEFKKNKDVEIKNKKNANLQKKEN